MYGLQRAIKKHEWLIPWWVWVITNARHFFNLYQCNCNVYLGTKFPAGIKRVGTNRLGTKRFEIKRLGTKGLRSKACFLGHKFHSTTSGLLLMTFFLEKVPWFIVNIGNGNEFMAKSTTVGLLHSDWSTLLE